jgi:transposase
VLPDDRQVKNLPGRPKRDKSYSRWLAACFERGAVTSCFVATPEFRLIRLHTRYRRDLTEERTRDKQRAEKLLESAAIKVSSVLSELHGVTGRDIMDHLIAGERDPKKLAQLARGVARRKIRELEAALEGAEFFTPEHAALLATMLQRIDRADQDIAALTEVIERLLAPWEEQLQQAGSMPGWGRRSAQDALAETGPDMTRFPTGGHLASWAGRTPLDHQSGTRKGKARARKGNRYLAGLLGETATAAGRTQTREGARYRKLARSRGKLKAQVALGNTQLKVYHALLSRPFRLLAGELPEGPPAPPGLGRPLGSLALDTFNLMGTSVAGAAALGLALHEPGRVRALVLEAPTAIRPDKRDADLERRLSDLATPTLVLFGTADDVVAPAMGRVYKASMSNCHLVFVYAAGHLISADRPEAFTEVVVDFLERHEAFVISRARTVIHP